MKKYFSTVLDFSTFPTIYYKREIMENKKRIYRELNDETKAKISQSSKNRPKSDSHKMHISQSMKRYWQTVPHRPEIERTTMNDLIGAEDND